MCACADYSNTIFPGKYVHIYNRVARRKAAMAALLARDGSNRPWAYLAYGECKLGSNRHRWRDMAMIQSALTACASYIRQTNCQLTAAHYFTMEKCVNVHKSIVKKCDKMGEYSYEKCKNHDQCYFGANINHDVYTKVMLLMDVYVNLVCVLSIYLFNFIMRIADDVIGHVNDNVNVSAYEYVNVCADRQNI